MGVRVNGARRSSGHGVMPCRFPPEPFPKPEHHVVENGVDDWHENQGEHGGGDEASDDGPRHGGPHFRPGAEGQGQGKGPGTSRTVGNLVFEILIPAGTTPGLRVITADLYGQLRAVIYREDDGE